MLPLLHVPSRDARDADHLAIMLAAGGLLTIFRLEGSSVTSTLWFVMSVIAIISAPLIWLRVPHAKWGGVISTFLLGTPSYLQVFAGDLSIRTLIMIAAILVIAFWYYRIDYQQRFEE